MSQKSKKQKQARVAPAAPPAPSRFSRPLSRRQRVALAVGTMVVVAGGLVFADWWRVLPDDRQATYVGSHACIECHQDYYDQWRGSHHDLAMDRATPDTVQGDFDDVHFEHHGIQSRLFRRDGKYMVHTEGPDGEMADFEIKYVFGHTPLQQYMVEFDRPDDLPEDRIARLQVLRICWDTERRRWFYLPPPDVAERLAPDDDLHWTGIAQRWNNMCADCHSTNLQKNYDHQAGVYHTSFSEISVGCEACHGPGSLHIELANQTSLFWDRKLGYGLPSLKDNARTEIHSCAPCHARRRVVYPGFLPGDNYYDHYATELLERNTYFADGQILDEDFEYASFLQSKMYHEGIRCTDCHDPHTTRVKYQGNAVCTSCHQHPAGKYDSPSHHFHKPGTPGAACVECHMPETTYMEVDPRRDHSIRNPRPDLSVELGLPNACTRCHLDKHAAGLGHREDLTQYLDWMLAARDGDREVQQALAEVDAEMAEAYREWYGDPQPAGPREKRHFAHALVEARKGNPEAEDELIDTATDRRLPGIVRATAMQELAQYDSQAAIVAAVKGLQEPEPQVRATAIANLQGRLPPEQLADTLAPLLADPIRLVRTEAARVLSTVPANLLPRARREDFQKAIREFETGLMVNNDRAAAHLTLGILREGLGDQRRAIEAYRTAIHVEPGFVGPRTNLAALYDRLAEDAERRLRQATLLQQRETAEQATEQIVRYRQQSRELRREELDLMERDARLVPDNAAVQYRYGMLLYLHRRLDEAENALLRAAALEPNNPQFLLGVVLFYQEVNQLDEALPLAEKLVAMRPDDPVYRQILQNIRREISRRED